MWPFERKLSVDEAEEKVHISRMRNALYELIWIEAHKNDKHPRPMPLQYLDDTWIIEELKEIING